jgi:hypothetical protein
MRTFFQLRERTVQSADKKPQQYRDQEGKTRTRMVPADKDIISGEATIPDGQTVMTKKPKPQLTKNDSDKLNKVRSMMKRANESYRVHAVSKDGETMKSGQHATKKLATDMHYKMAKSGMYKSIKVHKEETDRD